MAKAKTQNAKPKTPPPASKPVSQEQPQFSHDGKTYRVILHAVVIPGIGHLTAADIATDEAAQQYLVEAGTLGSVLEEVVE